MTENTYVFGITAVIALTNIALRFLPFALFRKKTPAPIVYLGEVLPLAIMGMLIVYCLKDVSVLEGSRGIPEAIAVAAVVLLHKWKHNTLLSIFAGTILYMFLVQTVFI